MSGGGPADLGTELSAQVVFGTQHGDDKVLPVGLPLGENQVADQGVGLASVAYLRISEGDALILDQADAIDTDGFIVRLGLKLGFLGGALKYNSLLDDGIIRPPWF